MIGQSVSLADMTPDGELIQRIKTGEKELFEIIMRRYNQRMYRIGMSILSDEAETEDAMQNAYISCYEHLHQFENRSAFSTWLTRIMINQCFEQKRKQKKYTMKVENTDNVNTSASPATLLVNKELGSVMEKTIAQLPEIYRTVFVLREIEDLSVKETSEALSIEVPNVKVRLNRAKTMLKESLSGYMNNHVYDFHLSKCDRIVSFVMSRILAMP